MFLVRRAKDVMDTDIMVLPADMASTLSCACPNTRAGCAMWWSPRASASSARCASTPASAQGLEGTYTGVKLGEVAQHNFTIAREDDIMFDVVRRMTRHDAGTAYRHQGLAAVGAPRTLSA